MTTDNSRIHDRDRSEAANCALCQRRWRPADFEDAGPHNEYRVVPGPHPLAERGVVGGGNADRHGEAVSITVCPPCMDLFWPKTPTSYRTDRCLACKRTSADVPDAFEADARIPTEQADSFGNWLAICDDCLAAFRTGRPPRYADDRYFNFTADFESVYLDHDDG